jgi:hypothetical protein
MAKEAFSLGTLIEFVNQGLIIIISKKVGKDSIEGWRPITLSVLYKIWLRQTLYAFI